jgi:uncharacterized protein YsxB (DUF464 family)
MIRVHIFRNSDGFINKFTVQGHAGYARHGKDIICAAISAIAYTALGALEELADVKGYTENDGFLECNIPTGMSPEKKDKAEVILETMAIGFKQIEYSYKKYVVVLDKEVLTCD